MGLEGAPNGASRASARERASHGIWASMRATLTYVWRCAASSDAFGGSRASQHAAWSSACRIIWYTARASFWAFCTPQPTRVTHLRSGGWAPHLNFGLLTSPRTQMRQRAQERPRESPVEKTQTSPVVSSNFNKQVTRGCRKGSRRIRRGGGSSGSSSPSWMERVRATLSAAATARGRAPDGYHSELVMCSRGLLRGAVESAHHGARVNSPLAAPRSPGPAT